MIHGVKITPLKQFSDENGKVMHMLRADQSHFEGFGEIYFSTVKPNAIKAWRRHNKMTVNLAVPVGRILLVLYDDRNGSSTKGNVQEISLGGDDYALVTIPPLIWNGFMGIGSEEALIANCATLPHDPDEVERCMPVDASIPYSWESKSP